MTHRVTPLTSQLVACVLLTPDLTKRLRASSKYTIALPSSIVVTFGCVAMTTPSTFRWYSIVMKK